MIWRTVKTRQGVYRHWFTPKGRTVCQSRHLLARADNTDDIGASTCANCWKFWNKLVTRGIVQREGI